jgi:hypothetical protein
MSELVDQVAANVGLDRTVAETAIGIILDFLTKEGPADKVSALLARLPGSHALLQAARAGGGDDFGGGMGGLMGVGTRLMGAGLDLAQIQAVGHELLVYSRAQGADGLLVEIAGAIPGLGQFI